MMSLKLFCQTIFIAFAWASTKNKKEQYSANSSRFYEYTVSTVLPGHMGFKELEIWTSSNEPKGIMIGSKQIAMYRNERPALVVSGEGKFDPNPYWKIGLKDKLLLAGTKNELKDSLLWVFRSDTWIEVTSMGTSDQDWDQVVGKTTNTQISLEDGDVVVGFFGIDSGKLARAFEIEDDIEPKELFNKVDQFFKTEGTIKGFVAAIGMIEQSKSFESKSVLVKATTPHPSSSTSNMTPKNEINRNNTNNNNQKRKQKRKKKKNRNKENPRNNEVSQLTEGIENLKLNEKVEGLEVTEEMKNLKLTEDSNRSNDTLTNQFTQSRLNSTVNFPNPETPVGSSRENSLKDNDVTTQSIENNNISNSKDEEISKPTSQMEPKDKPETEFTATSPRLYSMRVPRSRLTVKDQGKSTQALRTVYFASNQTLPRGMMISDWGCAIGNIFKDKPVSILTVKKMREIIDQDDKEWGLMLYKEEGAWHFYGRSFTGFVAINTVERRTQINFENGYNQWRFILHPEDMIEISIGSISDCAVNEVKSIEEYVEKMSQSTKNYPDFPINFVIFEIGPNEEKFLEHPHYTIQKYLMQQYWFGQMAKQNYNPVFLKYDPLPLLPWTLRWNSAKPRDRSAFEILYPNFGISLTEKMLLISNRLSLQTKSNSSVEDLHELRVVANPTGFDLEITGYPPFVIRQMRKGNIVQKYGSRGSHKLNVEADDLLVFISIETVNQINSKNKTQTNTENQTQTTSENKPQVEWDIAESTKELVDKLTGKIEGKGWWLSAKVHETKGNIGPEFGRLEKDLQELGGILWRS